MEMPLGADAKPSEKWLALLAAFLGWMFDGLEMGLFPLVARPALHELIGPGAADSIGTWFSLIMAGFLLGAALGGVIFGWLGDRIGRVRAMVWSVLVYSVFSGLCGFAQTPWQLGALRFLAALGMGGEWALGVALVMEIWPARARPLMAGLIGAASNVGFLLIAVMGLGLTKVIGELGAGLRGMHLPEPWVQALLAGGGWRILLFLGAMPAFLTLVIQLFVPESRRWQRAAQGAPKNRLADVFRGGLARTSLLGIGLGAVALLGTWGSVQWIPAWADRLSNKMPEAKSYAQICSGGGAIVFSILAALMAQWSNRRWTYFGMCALSLLACEILFLAPFAFGWRYLGMVFLVGGMSASFYGWLPLYLPELFPTRLRATGQGLAFNFGRILAAAGTLGAGQLLNAIHEDYAGMCSVISLVYILGMILIWFCPETKGKPLPE
jgi:MFS family permease